MTLMKPRKVVQWMRLGPAPPRYSMAVLRVISNRSPIRTAALGLAWMGSLAVPLRAQEVPTPAVATAPAAADSPELAEMVRQLDDDRFAVREAAQQRLVTLGR